MTMSNCMILIAVVTTMLSGFGFAGEVTREGALELMEECQRQREENIAPLREQAVAAERHFRMNTRSQAFNLP